MKRLPYTRLLALAAVLFFSFLLFRGIEDASQENYGDFHSYFKGGLAFRNGAPLYFDTEEPSFRYSPFFALFMSPFTLLPKQTAYMLWILLMICQAFLILFWTRSLASRQGRPDSPPDIWLYGASLILIPNFFIANFDKAQANIFVLFWICWSLVWLDRNRPWQAGLCLAVSILTKLTPLLFLPYLLWKRQFKYLASCVLGIVILLILPWFIQGYSDGLETLKNWVAWTKQAHDHYFLAAQANQSLFGAVHRFFSVQENAYSVELGFATLKAPIEAVKIVYAVLGAVIYASFAFKPNTRLLKAPYVFSDTFLEFSGFLIPVTLAFPVAWKYAFVNLLLPVMVILIYLYRNSGRDFVVLGLLAGFFILGTGLPSLPVYSVRIHAHFYSSITWATILLAIAFLKLKHRPLNTSSIRT